MKAPVSCCYGEFYFSFKTNIQKSVTFVYSNNELLEKVRKQAYYHCIKKNKIPRNKPI